MSAKASRGPFIAGMVFGIVLGLVGAWFSTAYRYDAFGRNPYPEMPLKSFDRVAWIGGAKTTYEQRVNSRNGMRESVKRELPKGMTVIDVIRLLGPPEDVRSWSREKVSIGDFQFGYTIGVADDGFGPFHSYSWPEMLFVGFSADGHLEAITEDLS